MILSRGVTTSALQRVEVDLQRPGSGLAERIALRHFQLTKSALSTPTSPERAMLKACGSAPRSSPDSQRNTAILTVGCRTAALRTNAPQNRNRYRTVGPRSDLPRKLIPFHLVGAHLGGVVLIRERAPVDAEGDGVIRGIQRITSKVDARAERSVPVFFGRSLELVSGGELEALGAVDLHRVVAVGGEDDEAVGIRTIVGDPRTVREKFLRSGENPSPNNGWGLRDARKGDNR